LAPFFGTVVLFTDTGAVMYCRRDLPELLRIIWVVLDGLYENRTINGEYQFYQSPPWISDSISLQMIDYLSKK